MRSELTTFRYYVVSGDQDATDQKIESFSALPENWHYGVGGPPKKEIIDFVKAIRRVVSGDQDATDQKIESFSALPENWHYGVGGPPKKEIIDFAKAIRRQLTQIGFTKTDAFPGADGEVMVTGYSHESYLEVLIESDCRASVRLEKGRQQLFEKTDLSERDALEQLTCAAGIAWNSSGSFIQSIMTSTGTSLRASPSRQFGTGVRQFYGSNALRVPA